MDWYTVDNKRIDLVAELEKYIDKDVLIHIGTDAQATKKVKRKADFVTVVCVHTIGKGGRVFYWRGKKVPVHSLWEKLYGETERSLRVAVELTDTFGQSISEKILVHVDANPDKRWASSSYVKQLAGMVMGYGFKHVLKPDAFVASHAADHIVKHKNDRNK